MTQKTLFTTAKKIDKNVLTLETLFADYINQGFIRDENTRLIFNNPRSAIFFYHVDGRKIKISKDYKTREYKINKS